MMDGPVELEPYRPPYKKANRQIPLTWVDQTFMDVNERFNATHEIVEPGK